MHTTVGSINLDIRAIAYHESGHAVMGYFFKRPFKNATIEPREPERFSVEGSGGEPEELIGDTGYAGQVDFETDDIESILVMSESVHWLKHHPNAVIIVRGAILTAMAGYIAQYMGVPESVRSLTCDEDRKAADLMLGNIFKEDWLAEREKARSEAKAIVREKWHLIELVAQTLLEKRTISQDDVCRLCES